MQLTKTFPFFTHSLLQSFLPVTVSLDLLLCHQPLIKILVSLILSHMIFPRPLTINIFPLSIYFFYGLQISWPADVYIWQIQLHLHEETALPISSIVPLSGDLTWLNISNYQKNPNKGHQVCLIDYFSDYKQRLTLSMIYKLNDVLFFIRSPNGQGLFFKVYFSFINTGTRSSIALIQVAAFLFEH